MGMSDAYRQGLGVQRYEPMNITGGRKARSGVSPSYTPPTSDAQKYAEMMANHNQAMGKGGPPSVTPTSASTNVAVPFSMADSNMSFLERLEKMNASKAERESQDAQTAQVRSDIKLKEREALDKQNEQQRQKLHHGLMMSVLARDGEAFQRLWKQFGGNEFSDFQVQFGGDGKTANVSYPGQNQIVQTSVDDLYKTVAVLDPRFNQADALGKEDRLTKKDLLKHDEWKVEQETKSKEARATARRDAIKRYYDTFTAERGGLIEGAPTLEGFISNYMSSGEEKTAAAPKSGADLLSEFNSISDAGQKREYFNSLTPEQRTALKEAAAGGIKEAPPTAKPAPTRERKTTEQPKPKPKATGEDVAKKTSAPEQARKDLGEADKQHAAEYKRHVAKNVRNFMNAPAKIRERLSSESARDKYFNKDDDDDKKKDKKKKKSGATKSYAKKD